MAFTAGTLALAGCSSKGGDTSSDTAAAPSGGTSSSSSSSSAPAATALKPVLPAGDGKAKCASGLSLAYIGTINGDSAALGQAIRNGAKLAVDQHNAANPGCKVGFKQFDSEGSPDKAPGVVTQAINSKDIIGVVGLPFSGESKAVGKAFNSAGLVTITPSATNPGLSQNGWKTFFRALGNDASQGPAAAKFISDDLKASKVCVIQDDSEYGTGLGAAVKKALGSKVTCTDDVKTKQTDFSATVNKVVGAQPDAVFYAGYYPEAGPLAQQLKQQGYQGKFVAPDGTKDPEFIKAAGQSAAQGAYFTCPCVPADAAAKFASEYKKAYGTEPQTYSSEAYDAATIQLAGIDKGNTTRAKLLTWVKGYDADGITKHYKFAADGELSGTVAIWSYVVKGNEIVKYKQLS
ncbi:branched-chain amino acid ABC transporter substrate-binding protein [Jatrophihabitans endophyticus]|uniref:branched-chain amino acid ABC transporter substrate-binding protein n=1 Tax=Jatrophihabitans endophyticus TaxID=1206085 RepID=UPI000A012206|nr:branched-chain amino acid ABC transporter substrate-binding protein [Jatrophihabitans endophyticus]